MNIISKEQAMFYESAKTSFVMSFVYLWFPKYFIWVCNKRYKRYTEHIIMKVKTMKPTGMQLDIEGLPGL